MPVSASAASSRSHCSRASWVATASRRQDRIVEVGGGEYEPVRGLVEAQPAGERERRGIGRLRERALADAVDRRAAGQHLPDPPEPDDDREHDELADRAERRALLDHERRGVALDVEREPDRARTRTGEPHGELERLAHGTGRHRREAEEAVRRHAHLQAEMKRERGLASTRHRARDDRLAHAKRHARGRIGERRHRHREAVEQRVRGHVPSAGELDEIVEVGARQVEHWPEMITTRHVMT
jgi:hypothetical protein